MPTTKPATALDRLITAAEDAIKVNAHDGDPWTDLGAGSAMEYLREAIPTARAILLLGNPLDSDPPPLRAFIASKWKELEATALEHPDPDGEKAAISERCFWYTALVVGVLLADRV